MRLIDADELIRMIRGKKIMSATAKVMMLDAVEESPTIDAAPVVHGRWDERHVDYASDCAIDEVQALRCSVCRRYLTTPYMYSFSEYKFCPNCGAKMDGEGDA